MSEEMNLFFDGILARLHDEHRGWESKDELREMLSDGLPPMSLERMQYIVLSRTADDFIARARDRRDENGIRLWLPVDRHIGETKHTYVMTSDEIRGWCEEEEMTAISILEDIRVLRDYADQKDQRNDFELF